MYSVFLRHSICILEMLHTLLRVKCVCDELLYRLAGGRPGSDVLAPGSGLSYLSVSLFPHL